MNTSGYTSLSLVLPGILYARFVTNGLYLSLMYSGAIPQAGAYFGEGSDLIHLDYINCTGTEYSLTDCETRSHSRESIHSEDVGVQCQPGMVME